MQGVGIPLITVIEIVSIWVLSLILAVPEAVGFDIITFDYANKTMRTCMLRPRSAFMEVRCYHFAIPLKKLHFVPNFLDCAKARMCKRIVEFCNVETK